MATASTFTKVSVIMNLSLKESDALLLFLEQAHPTGRNADEQVCLVTIYKALKKAMKNV